MLKIRLQRRGKRNFATYRVVVAEHHAPIQGRFIEDLGSYNPHTNALAVKAERLTQWVAQGAQPSATLHNLLVTNGLLKAEKVTIWRPPQSEAEPAAAGNTSQPSPAAPTPTTPAAPTPETPAAT